MTRGTMPINKDEYNNKKEYYDYQRKVEYNREQIEKATERFNGRVFNQHGPVHLPDLSENLWDKIDPSEYEDPPKSWVPKDEKWQIEGENMPSGRKVVLRAKQQVLDN